MIWLQPGELDTPLLRHRRPPVKRKQSDGPELVSLATSTATCLLHAVIGVPAPPTIPITTTACTFEEPVITAIVYVRERGDAAVREYAETFDNWSPKLPAQPHGRGKFAVSGTGEWPADGPQLRVGKRTHRNQHPGSGGGIRVPFRAAPYGHRTQVGQAVTAMLHMPGLCGADIDLSAGMIAR